MRRLLLLLALGISACERQPQQKAPVPAPRELDGVASQGPVSKPAAVVRMPADQAELDRMILAGYTPHADHLHRPGVKECPLTEGSEAVM
jgi:hypothetical protein